VSLITAPFFAPFLEATLAFRVPFRFVFFVIAILRAAACKLAFGPLATVPTQLQVLLQGPRGESPNSSAPSERTRGDRHVMIAR
jgi:hypothetical protein